MLSVRHNTTVEIWNVSPPTMIGRSLSNPNGFIALVSAMRRWKVQRAQYKMPRLRQVASLITLTPDSPSMTTLCTCWSFMWRERIVKLKKIVAGHNRLYVCGIIVDLMEKKGTEYRN